MLMKSLRKWSVGLALVVGIGLGANLGMAGERLGPQPTPPQGCERQCVQNSDCDRICGPGAGVCEGRNGCGLCYCTM